MDNSISPKKYKKLKKSHKRLGKSLRASDEYNYVLVDENCDLFVENRELRKSVSVLSKLVAVGAAVLYVVLKSRRTTVSAEPQPTNE